MFSHRGTRAYRGNRIGYSTCPHQRPRHLCFCILICSAFCLEVKDVTRIKIRCKKARRPGSGTPRMCESYGQYFSLIKMPFKAKCYNVLFLNVSYVMRTISAAKISLEQLIESCLGPKSLTGEMCHRCRIVFKGKRITAEMP